MLGRNLDDADDGVRASDASVSDRSEVAAALAQRVAALSATAVGADQAIRVTVGSSGLITALELDDRVRQLTGVQLAEEIMRVMRRAQAALSERVAEAVEATVGANTETGRAVVGSFQQRFPVEPQEAPRLPTLPARAPFPSFPTVPQQSSGRSRG